MKESSRKRGRRPAKSEPPEQGAAGGQEPSALSRASVDDTQAVKQETSGAAAESPSAASNNKAGPDATDDTAGTEAFMDPQFLERQREMYARLQRSKRKSSRREERQREKSLSKSQRSAESSIANSDSPTSAAVAAGSVGDVTHVSSLKKDKAAKKAKKKKKKRERERLAALEAAAAAAPTSAGGAKDPSANAGSNNENRGSPAGAAAGSDPPNPAVPKQLVVVAPFMRPLGPSPAKRRGPAAQVVDRLNLASVCNLLPQFFPLKKRLRYLEDLQQGSEAAATAAAANLAREVAGNGGEIVRPSTVHDH
eukprot:INCI13979.1.p3 GENE.INCI13979.1~~INCI13979.1.p3  ORF type:complete len:309 (-),score=74.83 INCI13979.1:1448-2374(-)